MGNALESPVLAPQFFGVRCVCGAYMAFCEVPEPPRPADCDRLRQPAWIVCIDCGDERRYTQSDLLVFTWPPTVEDDG